MSKSKAQCVMLPIEKIRTDGGTQIRAAINPAWVDDYAEKMQEGAKFPPITVYYDGENYWLSDGFTRLAAGKKRDFREMESEVRSGNRDDAILDACGANAEHGEKRSNADKRRAVETLLRHEVWGKRTPRWIADACKVSPHTVATIAEELGIVQMHNAPATRTTKDGRQYPAKRSSQKRGSAIEKKAAETGKSEWQVQYEDRLQRKAPDLLEQVKAGVMPLRSAYDEQVRRKEAYIAETGEKDLPDVASRTAAPEKRSPPATAPATVTPTDPIAEAVRNHRESIKEEKRRLETGAPPQVDPATSAEQVRRATIESISATIQSRLDVNDVVGLTLRLISSYGEELKIALLRAMR
jgi:hypothetical protein